MIYVTIFYYAWQGFAAPSYVGTDLEKAMSFLTDKDYLDKQCFDFACHIETWENGKKKNIRYFEYNMDTDKWLPVAKMPSEYTKK